MEFGGSDFRTETRLDLSGNDKLYDFLKDDFAKFGFPSPYSCARILDDELGWEGNLCANLFNPHFGGKIFLHVNAVVCAKNEVFPYMFHVHSKKGTFNILDSGR